MRILHIIQRYLPAHGGAERYLHEIAKRLVRDGHEVVTFTTDAAEVSALWDPRGRRFATHFEIIDGVKVYRFPVRHLPGGAFTYAAIRRLLWGLSRTPLPTSLAHFLAQFTPYVPDLFARLAATREHFHVVAGMTIVFEPLLYAGLLFARRTGTPFLVFPLTHLGAGPAPGQDDLSAFYTMRHQVEIVQSADFVITQTPDETNFYARFGIPTERMIEAGAGVTPENVLEGNGARFRSHHNIPTNEPLVGMIGTLSRDKGADDVLRAACLLWKRGLRFRLVLAGFTPPALQACIARLSAEERARITLLGPVDDATKHDLLAALQVLVLPSRSDSFGIVYLEAWLYEKPVIGANVWGIRHVIAHEVDGLLVPFGSPDQLADAIAKLLTTPSLATQLGKQGKQKVLSRYLWDHVYARVRPAYECQPRR